MQLSFNFAKAMLPCILTGLQALSPVTSTEPLTLVNGPAAIELASNPHKNMNAQISYAEWKKRLQEAKSEVLIQTYETATFAGQTAAASPVPKPS